MGTSTPNQPAAGASEFALLPPGRLSSRSQPNGRGVNFTGFIMRSACEKSEQTLSDQPRFVLGDKQWKAFLAALDRPSKDKPRLRRLFREPHVAKYSPSEIR